MKLRISLLKVSYLLPDLHLYVMFVLVILYVYQVANAACVKLLIVSGGLSILFCGIDVIDLVVTMQRDNGARRSEIDRIMGNTGVNQSM